MEKGKKLTLEALMAKAEQRKMEKFEVHKADIPSMEGFLVLEKIPLTRIASMMDSMDGDSMCDNLEFNAALIYACCPLMRNKELQTAYDCKEPTDIVYAVLDDNMGDINLVVQAILAMYGLNGADDLKTAVKN